MTTKWMISQKSHWKYKQAIRGEEELKEEKRGGKENKNGKWGEYLILLCIVKS